MKSRRSPSYWNNFDQKGAIITIDAMGCQKEVAEKIVHADGEYVSRAKDNHPKLCTAIAEQFTTAHEADFKGITVRHLETNETGHGLLETLNHYQSSSPESMRHQTKQRAKMKTICQVVSLTERDGRETSDVRYYTSILPLGVKRLAEPRRIERLVNRRETPRRHARFQRVVD